MAAKPKYGSDYAQGTDIFGLRANKDNSITYREWAPNAVRASLVGDFSRYRILDKV